MAKLVTIFINILKREVSVTSSSGVEKVEFDKQNYGPAVMKFIEDYITENGLDVINAESTGNFRYYYLIKR